MKGHLFLLLLLLCQLLVMEEVLAKEAKGEESNEKNQVEVGGGPLQVRNSMEETVGGRESDRREVVKGESEGRGPPRLRKGMEVVVGRVGQEVKLVCPITGNPTPIIEWEKVGDQTLNILSGIGNR